MLSKYFYHFKHHFSSWLYINKPLETHIWNLILSNFLFLFLPLFTSLWELTDLLLLDTSWAVATSSWELRDDHVGCRPALFFLNKVDSRIYTAREIPKKGICKNMWTWILLMSEWVQPYKRCHPIFRSAIERHFHLPVSWRVIPVPNTWGITKNQYRKRENRIWNHFLIYVQPNGLYGKNDYDSDIHLSMPILIKKNTLHKLRNHRLSTEFFGWASIPIDRLFCLWLCY